MTAKAHELLRWQDADDRAESQFIAAKGEKMARSRDRVIRSFKRTQEYHAARSLDGNTFPHRSRSPDPRDVSISTRQWEQQVQRWKKTTQFLDPLMRVHPWIGACTFCEFTNWLKQKYRCNEPIFAEYHKYWKSLPILYWGSRLCTPTGVADGARNPYWMGIWY